MERIWIDNGSRSHRVVGWFEAKQMWWLGGKEAKSSNGYVGEIKHHTIHYHIRELQCMRLNVNMCNSTFFRWVTCLQRGEGDFFHFPNKEPLKTREVWININPRLSFSSSKSEPALTLGCWPAYFAGTCYHIGSPWCFQDLDVVFGGISPLQVWMVDRHLSYPSNLHSAL